MNILDQYSIVSNSCVGYAIYEEFLNQPLHLIDYNNPFIASLILEDNDYLKLCCSYDYYLAQNPIFKEPKQDSLWLKQSGNLRLTSPTQFPVLYPVMHLDDIEIHWIHNSNADHQNILKKFKGRYNQGKYLDTIFIWSISEMFNLHNENERKKIIKQFLSISDKSILLTNRQNEVFEDQNHISVFMSQWKNKLETDRKIDFTVKWSHQRLIAKTCKQIIEEKFNVKS